MVNVSFSGISISMKSLGIYLPSDDQDWLCRQKMSKEGNMEIKIRFMYVNPTIRSDTHVAFSLCY